MYATPKFFLATLAVSVSCAISATEDISEAEKEALERISVHSPAYRSTGTKSTLLPIESPMSFTSIDQGTLQLRQADSVNRALRYVSGITPESRSTVTIFDQYTIRGFESYRNYYDGLPLQTNNLWNLYPQVDAFATESIEVLKGPTSVLYGSAPPGGMVNQIAKSPQGEQTTIGLRLGNQSLRELSLDTSGGNGEIDYRFIALARQKDGQQQTTEEERYTIAPTITWQVAAKTHLTFSAYYQDDPEITPSTPLPAMGTLYTAPYGKLDSDGYAGDENWARFDRTVTMLGYKINHEFNENLSFLQNFRYTDAKALQHNTYNQGLMADNSHLLRSAYFTNESQQGFVVDNQLAASLMLGQTQHNILFGFDFQTLSSDVSYGDTLGNDTPALNLAAPDYQLLNPETLPVDFYTEQHDIAQYNRGFYLQDEIEIDQLTFIVGGRYDNFYTQDIADKSYAGTEYGDTTTIDEDAFTGRLAAIYSFDFGLAPYLNYSTSFEPTPGFDSETNEAFKPTTAEQIEVGVKYQNTHQNMMITAAYFDLAKENVVVNTADFAKKTQTGEIVSRGIEVELNAQPTTQLDITANYTYLDMEITKNPLNVSLIGNRPVWVADQTASLWANYHIDNATISGLMLSAGVRYTGESYLDAANSDTLPSYTLYDIAARYEINDLTQLTISVNNLTDERYVGACYDANGCWMGAERTMEAGVKFSF
ncbi:TonB-dependent siderophore receptor [Colwellia asteriadis]|uniref:TonB-dependent siderophore receptor n=1 Tax=Colwellia asteriadis TaxID=517723 RepID=A0ABP3WJM8_9GAMM